MDGPNFEAARNYALERLETELPDDLSYHSLSHTRDDVVPAADRLAELEGINGEERILLLTAAWYHDIGFIERYPNNEMIGARIAEENLLRFGYTPEQIQMVKDLIMATCMPQQPHSLLQKIIADADMDSLGREDFFVISDNLRVEMAVRGEVYAAEDWYQKEFDFLKSHRYFTAAARQLRDAGKERNIQVFADLLETQRR